MLLVASLLACSGGRPDARLPQVDCPFDQAGRAMCYELDTPAGTVVVSVIPAERRVRRVPLVLQNGGPGSSPWDDLGELATVALHPALGANRDLVIVETRGSRYSERPMPCPAYLDALAELASGEGSDDVVEGALIGCFDAWHDDGVDFGALTGPRLADDIAAAVDGLGYGAFDYYGVSFGTIIGQHLLRDHGDRLGAVALDGAVPLGTNYVDELGRNADAAFGTLAAACASDPDCAASYGDLHELLARRLEALDDEPVLAVLETSRQEVSVDGDAMVELIVQLLYFGSAAEYVPALLDVTGPPAAAAYGSVLDQLGGTDPWSDDAVVGLNIPATCAETSRADADDVAVTGFGARAGLGLPVAELCARLGLPQGLDGEHSPITTDRPVLVTSGEHDPVTPPRYGRELAARLDAVELTFSGTGHGALLSDCGFTTLLTFFDIPDAQGLGACRNEDQIELQPPF